MLPFWSHEDTLSVYNPSPEEARPAEEVSIPIVYISTPRSGFVSAEMAGII